MELLDPRIEKYMRSVLCSLCKSLIHINNDLVNENYQIYFYDNAGKGPGAKTIVRKYIKQLGIPYKVNHNCIFLTEDAFINLYTLLKMKGK